VLHLLLQQHLTAWLLMAEQVGTVVLGGRGPCFAIAIPLSPTFECSVTNKVALISASGTL